MVTDCVLKHGCAGKEVRMADVQLYYLSKALLKLLSLTSPEQSETAIAHTLECLKAEYLQLKQRAGKEARLDCDLSPQQFDLRTPAVFDCKILASPVQLYALDFSCNRILAAPALRSSLLSSSSRLRRCMSILLAITFQRCFQKSRSCKMC